MSFENLVPSTVAVKFLAAVLLLGGAYGWGRMDGGDLAAAQALRESALVGKAVEAGLLSAAGEIAKLEIKHVTTQQRIERETRLVPVYSECRHSAGGLFALNAALENRAVAAGGGELPEKPGAGAR